MIGRNEKNITFLSRSSREIAFKNQSIFFLTGSTILSYPSNWAAEANSFLRRAAKLGQYRKQCLGSSTGTSQRGKAGDGQHFFLK